MSCKFSQHDSNMNALQHSMAPPPNAHAPQPGMNYIRSGSQGGGHKDHRISSPHHLQQRQPQHLQQQQYYNQHVPQPQQRYTQQPQQQQQSSHMMRFTSSGGYGAPSHGQQQQQVHHHQQQRQQQQQPSYHHQQQQQHSQNHPSAQQQQPSQNHMVSNAMSYRDNTCRSQSPRPQPQVVRLPPINFEDETPSPDNGRYDNDRIQNDLLDEICSDIGIKDAIDLDMFDFDANAEHYVIQPTRLPDDLDSLDQTIPFSAMTKQEDLLVPDGAIEGLSNAPQYPQQSSHVKVSSTSAVPRSMTEESIASPTISSSSNSHKANVGSSRPSSVSSADSPAAVHSTTSSTGSSDKHEADARPDVDQCTSDDQKALMCPGFLQRLATASPHEGDVSSPSPRPADLKTEHPANKLPASPYNMANTCQTSVASSPYKTGDKPSMSRSISRPQRSLSSPFDPGYFSIGSPTVCTANNQYEGSTNLSAAGPNCADDTNSKVMRFLNQVSGTESGPGVVPDGISTSGTCSALTSKSNSPTGAPAKRPRIISNGSDLLEEMRERYMFTKGANIYAKSPNSAMPPPVQRSRMYPSNQPSAATSPGLPQQQHQQLSSCSMNSGEQQTFNFGHTATGFGGMSHNGSYSQQQQASQDMPPPPGLFPASCVGSMPRPASMQPPNPVAMQQPSSPACMGGGGPSGMYGSCPDLSPPRGQVYPQQQQQQQQHQGYNSSQQQLPQPPCYASQGANSSQMLSTSSSSVPGSFSAPNTPSKHPQQPRPYNHTMAGSQMRQNLMRMYPTTPQHPQQQQPQGGVGVMDNQCLSGGVDISTDYHGQSHHMDPALHSPHLNGPMQTPVDMLPGNSTPSMQAGDPHLANLPSSSSSTSLSHGFMQHLINDRSSAFRSHPLFPLLRDLIIADMNFHSPSFPFALIANLPADFDRLLQNYLARNPPLPNQQNNDAVQGVIMDALKYAHSALIEKIQCRKVKEGYDGSDKPLCAIEDFCERFDRAVKNTMKPDRDVGGGMPPPPPNVTAMQPQHQHHGQAYPQYQRQPPSSVAQQPRHQYQQQQQPMMTPPSPYSHLDPFTFPGERRSQSLPPSPARKPLPHPFLQAGGGMAGGHMMAGSDFNIHMSAGKRSHDQTHSTGSGGKNKVLPKEAVQLMLDWLRQHQDNPYPNDDEKEMLINKTKLTINQINYWFTNARRRILPKWALQRYMEQQEKQKEAEKKKSQEADSPPPLVGSTKAS